jgi:hypothetical protein
MDDGTVVVLSPDSFLVIELLDGSTDKPITQFFLNLGEMFSLRATPLPENAFYEIKTPNGIAAIRGSAMSTSYNPDTDVTEVACLEGSCNATLGENSRDLTGGQWIGIRTDGIDDEPQAMTVDQYEAWDRIFEAIDQSPIQAEIAAVCACEEADFVCQDGTEIENYVRCVIDEPACQCDAADLVCDDGSRYDDNWRCTNPVILESDPGPPVGPYCGDAMCQAEEDETLENCPEDCDPDFEPKPLPEGCQCEGVDMVCDDGSFYPNDDFCGGSEPPPNGGCGDNICDDFETANRGECPIDCGCHCEGPDAVCDDGEVITNAVFCVGGDPKEGDDLCGDGICDQFEKDNPGECPEDCEE